MLNLAMYRREANNARTVERYAKDLPPDRLDRLVYHHPLVGLGIGVATLCPKLRVMSSAAAAPAAA